MPLAPVAYEAAARRPRASYETRVREVLSTLGSQNPDEDIAATGPLLENSKKAKMDPAAAAGIIYATSRHRHPPTSVLHGREQPTSTPKKHDVKIFIRKVKEPYSRTGYAYRAFELDGTPLYLGSETYKGAVARVREEYPRAEIVDATGGVFDEYAGARRPITAAEDSSPAPCTKPVRTVSSECQRLAKEIGPIRSDKELYALIAPSMRKETQETFVVVCCDVHGNLVAFTEVARGQVSRVAVDIEDVLGAVLAVRPRPTIYYVAHVHPSSKARPSEADEKLTEAIRRASAVAMPNVVFGDHIIVAGGESSREYYTFSDKKLKKG